MDIPNFFQVGPNISQTTKKDPLNSKNSGVVGCLMRGLLMQPTDNGELKTPQSPLVIFDPNRETPFEMDYINGFL